MENVPNKIYLQIGEDADVTIDNSINDFNDLFRSAITWADERINDNDIEYERRQNDDLKSAALPIFDVIKRFLAHGITLDIDFGGLPYKIISYGAGRDEDYFVLEPISDSEVYRYYKRNILESELKSALANVL